MEVPSPNANWLQLLAWADKLGIKERMRMANSILVTKRDGYVIDGYPILEWAAIQLGKPPRRGDELQPYPLGPTTHPRS